jgi:hypothetical protein
MSINGSENIVAAIELDMQEFLRPQKVRPLPEIKVRPLPETKDTKSDYPSEAFQLSGRSVQEIDHLIEGLRGVR